MASARELDWSYEGSTRGVLGVGGSRLFVVTIDTRGSDPTDAPNITGLPLIGENHPLPNFSSAEVVDYDIVENVSPTVWVVAVVYETPDGRQSTRWATSTSFANETEQVNTDANGVKVTIPLLVRDKTAGDSEAAFYAITSEETQRVNLKDTGAKTPILLDRSKNITVITKQRVVANVTDVQQLTVMNLKKSVHGTFDTSGASLGRRASRNKGALGFPNGTVLFDDFSIEETSGILRGQQIRGIVYDIRLVFLYKPDGWNRIEKVATFTDDNGHESIVQKVVATEEGHEDVVRIYDPYPTSNLLTVFEVFA